MFGFILKATNSSSKKGMTFCRSIYVKKVMKLLAFIFEQPSYFHNMAKTPVKFRKNRYKTSGGVVPTRHHLAIHFVIDDAGKWLSSTC